MEKLKDKRVIIPLAMIFIILIGITYAWMTITKNSTTINKITAGSLDLILDDSTSEGILLQNQVPMSFQQGITTRAYTFKLKNNSQTPADYSITLEDYYDGVTIPTEGKMIDEKIRYVLLKNDETPVASNSKLLSEGRTLETGVIQGSTEVSYTLYIWINSTAGVEVNGQIFSGRLNVEATQTAPSTTSYTYNNQNIVAAYKYVAPTNIVKDSSEPPVVSSYDGCITGEEEQCEQISIGATDTIQPGTIIKYKVNDTEEKYFHVLHDDGDKLTLQQRENTTGKTEWYSASSDNTQGPTTVLPVLENATSTWTNVNNLTYTMGTDTLYDNKYTGCSAANESILVCTENKYTLEQRINKKARMITGQETAALGCIYTEYPYTNCPVWLYNYLSSAVNNGGTNSGNNSGYWTMSALLDQVRYAWTVSGAARMMYTYTNYPYDYGARAVVEINK